MAEYIEKAALMGLIESEARRWGDDYDWWQCLADIEDFPSADVRPVVRGKWEHHNWGFDYDRCSVCGYEHRWPGPFYFCPNCGADMREDQP